MKLFSKTFCMSELHLSFMLAIGLLTNYASHSSAQIVAEFDLIVGETAPKIRCLGETDISFAAATEDGFISWGKTDKIRQNFPCEIAAAAFNGKNQCFVFAGEHEHLTLFDINEQSSTKLPVSRNYKPVSFSTNGRFMIAKDGRGNVQIFETSNWERVLPNVLGDDSGTKHACFSPDEKYVALGRPWAEDDLIQIWQIESSRQISGSAGIVTELKNMIFHSDGESLLVTGTIAGKRGMANIDRPTLRKRMFLGDIRDSESDFLFRVPNSTLIGMGEYLNLKFIDPADGKVQAEYRTDGRRRTGRFPYVTQDQSRYVMTGGDTLVVWDLNSSLNLFSPQRVAGRFHPVSDQVEIAWHPLGEWLAVATPFKHKKSSSGGSSIGMSVVSSTRDAIRDGSGNFGRRRAATDSADIRAEICTYDPVSGKRISQLTMPEKFKKRNFSRLKLSPSGKYIASMASSHLLLWDGKRNGLHTLDCRDFGFSSPEFLFGQDGKTVLLRGDRRLQQRSLVDGSILSKLEVPFRGSLEIFDGNRWLLGWSVVVLATGYIESRLCKKNGSNLRSTQLADDVYIAGFNSHITIWDTTTMRKKAPFVTGEFSDFSVSHDKQWLAVGYGDGSVRFWNIPTGRIVGYFKAHEGQVDTLRFHPKELTLATASREGQLHFWNLNSELITQ